MHKKYFKVRRIGDSIRISTWVEISSVVDGMVMVEEIDEEVEEVT
jgi:hypothetical protein